MVGSNTPGVLGYSPSTGEITRVRVRFSSEIARIDIATLTSRPQRFETGHDALAGLVSVRRSWNQTNIAMRFATEHDIP